MSRETGWDREGQERKARRQESVADLEAAIKADVYAKLLEGLEDQARLGEAGLDDPGVLRELPPDVGFDAVFRRLREAIVEEVAVRPSVLNAYDVRALDVLTPAGDEEEPATPSELVQVERTVVFTDLEGFTAFTVEKGDLEASALLTDHYDEVDAIVRGRGGLVVKKIGDGHMLSFEQPAAAVMASLDLVAATPGHLRLRAGAHGGAVVAADDDLLGGVVNLAARVTDLASGGESVVTTAVRDGAGTLPRIVYEAARLETVPGVDVPVEVCSVRRG
jgi:adenylate cyclase